MQGEKCKTSTQNLKQNNVALQAEGICLWVICISYFVAFR